MKCLYKAMLIACFASSTVYAADVKQSALPTKTTPVTGDKALIIDSADGNKSKNVTLGSLPVSTATQAALNLKAAASSFTSQSAFTTAWGWNPGDNLGSATAANISSLFSGSGDCLKSDGTKGDCGTGGSMTWPTSDSAYYGARNGAWVNLSGIFASPLGSDDNYVTDAEKVKLGNLSGTNTGDQDLSGYALTSSVLSKTNTTAFTPSGDYHPATKKYVDDSITAGGGYTDEQAQDAGGGMFSGNTETGITVTYNDTTGKVDFVVATQSDVNFTSTLNTKLAGIATGAEVNVNADWNSSSGDSQILNKPSTFPLTASMITGVFSGTGDCLGSNGEKVACGGAVGGLVDLSDVMITGTPPTNYVLKYNGTNWAPAADATAEGVGYVSTPPTYSDAACTAGQYALSESYRYDCVASGNWNRTALTDWTNLTPVAPTLTSRVISANGTTLTLTGSASLSVGAGGSGGFDIDCTTAGSGITATYVSGAPGSNIVYTLGSTVASGDTCDLDYTQPGNGIEGTTGGADLASITSAAITNNSTQLASNADAFTGTDGTALATHNANWANVGTDFLVANAVINSNHVRSTGAYNLFGGRYTASTSDTSVITLVGGATASEDNTMPVVRASATLSGYGCYFSASASGNFTAVRFRKNGAYLADGNTGTWAMASDHTMKIVASGTSPVSLSCYIDGVLVATATDSASPIASGNPGFTGYPDGNLAKSTFDNWSDQ